MVEGQVEGLRVDEFTIEGCRFQFAFSSFRGLELKSLQCRVVGLKGLRFSGTWGFR